MIGQVIGNYRLVSELGRGGMGIVYVAEHVQLGRPAALKMLLPQFSSDEAIVQRFFTEAKAASAVDHPGIVEIYDFGRHTDGRAYIVMALLKGETLQERLAREPLAPVEGATILAQVAGALAVAHARGIVHRDLKPDNIFLVPNELMPCGVQAKLLDFGIAKLADERASFKTQTGSLIGTPAYMSPEQCMGRSDLDHRTDLYALGCILFHVLCGRPPFVSDAGAGPMIAAHLRDPAPDPRAFNQYVSEPLAMIVLRLLEKDPRQRFQTALELRGALMQAGANVSLTRPIATEQPATKRYGPDATAPTTASGSAAQVVVASTPKPPASKKAMWISLGIAALAAAGITTFVIASSREKPVAKEPVAQQPAPLPEPPKPVDLEPKPMPMPTPIPMPSGSASPPQCPYGQSVRDDTNGHCCWPEQAWSTAKNKCVGAPRCPEGMLAKGDQCTTTPTITAVTDGASDAKFTLDAQIFAPAENVVFKFAQPMPSAGNRRAWVTIVEAGRAKDSYGTWEFVADNAKTAMLKAPVTPGLYEARLHTDYALRQFNLRHTVRFEVSPGGTSISMDPDAAVTPLAAQRFKTDATQYAPRAVAMLTFATSMVAKKNERFWVTIVKADAGDEAYTDYEYVAAGAKTMKFTMPLPAGEYELRLHANYPSKSRNVVHRVRVSVVKRD